MFKSKKALLSKSLMDALLGLRTKLKSRSFAQQPPGYFTQMTPNYFFLRELSDGTPVSDILTFEISVCNDTGLNTASDSLYGRDSWCQQEYIELNFYGELRMIPSGCGCYLKPYDYAILIMNKKGH